MILVDANLLVYACVPASSHHEAARQWLDGQIGTSRVGLPWASLRAFVRLVANPRVVDQPPTVAAAWDRVEAWLDHPSVWIPEPTDRHRGVLRDLLRSANQSRLVPDAHLAALAIEHGLVMCSADGDFARFPGLRWMNPLAKAS